MTTERPPLDPSAFKAVCAYATTYVILPDDVIRISADLRPNEPFIIDVSRLTNTRRLGKRFLSVLAELRRGNPTKFDTVAPTVHGRPRKYFGRTQAEVESTGNSNNAAEIPGTPWWASINNCEALRSDIIDRVMAAMGFSNDYRRMIGRYYLRLVAELPGHYGHALSRLPNA